MGLRIAIVALVTVWVCAGARPTHATVTFVGTYQDWDVRAEERQNGTICAARSLHPELTSGDIFWAFNTAIVDDQPNGYLALDPRFLPTGGSVTITIDDEARFSLVQGADGYIYAALEDDSEIFSLMRNGLEMIVRISPRDQSTWELPVSLLGFTRASDAALAACGLD